MNLDNIAAGVLIALVVVGFILVAIVFFTSEDR